MYFIIYLYTSLQQFDYFIQTTEFESKPIVHFIELFIY